MNLKIPLYLTLLLLPLLANCKGCEREPQDPPLKLPFFDNFDRLKLGSLWYTEAPGRWWIQYSETKRDGRLCAEQAQNLPLFLRRTLPDEVVVEFDAWAEESEGDVKIEIFTDGRFHATGYVLIHGGWHNRFSIIDRLDEHNKDRRWVRGGPIKGKRYHWKVVRRLEREPSGKTIGILEWFLDGKLYLSYRDQFPLLGKSHKYFAFSNWNARICFDNLKIYPYKRPEKDSSGSTTQPAAKRTTQKNRQPLPTIEKSTPQTTGQNSPPQQIETNYPQSPQPEKTTPPPARKQLVLSPSIQKIQKPLQLRIPILKLKTPIHERSVKPVMKIKLQQGNSNQNNSHTEGN